ncbi:MAG: DMT family transporter [Bacteroidota bacterium]
MSENHILKTILFTGFALIAFAANSVLCKLALGENNIDASSFTIIRLLSGAIVLFIIINIKKKKKHASDTKGNWLASTMLFLYAITFSLAYISLDTGTGALILFGSVQISMITLSIFTGTRLHLTEWIGFIIAFLGFVYLILPGVTAPSIQGFFFMTVAGIAWGIYTLIGRNSKDALKDTTYNFIKTIPLLIILTILAFKNINYTTKGIWLAVLSGGITSGIGYTIWYNALRNLTSTQAAVVQLLVPVIAALGGVIFISEKITFRLIAASFLILGGILIVVLGRKYFIRK